MKFGLTFVVAAGLLAGTLAPATALPAFGSRITIAPDAVKIEKVRCGYYGCRRGYGYYRPGFYRPAYRGYYRPYYYRPGIGIGIGGVGIGVY